MKLILTLVFSAILYISNAQVDSMTIQFIDIHIPTTLNAYDEECSGFAVLPAYLPLSDSIEITGIDIYYEFESVMGNPVLNQRSQIYCITTDNIEPVQQPATAAVNPAVYDRQNIDIANGTYVGGTTLEFQMRAWYVNDFGFPFGLCSSDVQRVLGGTWSIKIYFTKVNSRVGIETDNPQARLDVNGKLKIGDDSQSPTEGTLRYNQETSKFEGYTDEWEEIGKQNTLVDGDGDTKIFIDKTIPDSSTQDLDEISFFFPFGSSSNKSWVFSLYNMRNNVTSNLFIGNQSGVNTNHFSFFGSPSGAENIGIGANTLLENTYGDRNIAIGKNALMNSIEAINNISIGWGASEANISGDYNVVVGHNSFIANQSGGSNVVIGAEAFNNNVTGFDNIVIGATSGSTGSNTSNSIAIGKNVSALTNQVRLGNSSVTSIGGYANWTNVSDKRFKIDIKPDVVGLDFITLLEPVTYKLDLDGLANFHNIDYNSDNNHEARSIIRSGFLAQDVANAARSVGYDFSGVDTPSSDKDHFGLRYAAFVVPLVKAIQEQQEIIETQEGQLVRMQAELDSLKVTVERLLKK